LTRSITETISRLSAISLGILCGFAVFVVIAICVFVMAQLNYTNQKNFLDDELRDLAAAAASSIDGDLHNLIRDPAQLNGEEYARAIKPLVDLHNAIPKISYLYTMIDRGGEAFFILDTAADSGLDSDKDLEASAVMEKYELDQAEQAAWLGTLRAGKVFVDPKFVTDEFGTFVSGSAPFYDSHGTYAGFVGVDYDAGLYVVRKAQVNLALAISLAVGFLFSILIGIFVWRLKRSRDTSQVVRQIAESELAETSTLLNTALGSIDQGFLVWSKDSRVVVCNDRYHELWGYPKSLLEPGTPLLDLLRFRAQSGAYGEGDPEELAQLKMTKLLAYRDQNGARAVPAGDRVLYVRHFLLENGQYVTLCTDLTDLSRLQEALQESESRLWAIFDNTPICLNLKDTEGRYVLVNKPYEDWLGLSAEQIIGKRARDFMTNADEIQRVETTESEMLQTGVAVDSEIKVERPDGQIHDRYLVKFPVKANDGSITGIGSVSIDISELKQTERQLRSAKEQAEYANLSKSGFLATMSHELRTPLNAILGFSSMIQNQILGPINMPAYLEYASDINHSGQHLLNLINDLLDLSKIESGKYEFNPENLNLNSLILEAIHSVEPIASNKKILVIPKFEGDSLPLEADKRALLQILLNLLSNAIKFSSIGSQVTVSSRRVDDQICFVVSDHGIGIHADDIKKIVIPWEQIKDPTIADGGSSGLGLPIVNSLVELHKGNLEITSEPGKGTTVTILLPDSGS
jgi:PAS domain S-box-containing protein